MNVRLIAPRICIVFWIAIGMSAADALAQPSVDTGFSWRSYAREGTTHVLVFPTDPDDPTIVVLREVADNAGPSTINDIRHLVELIGREHGVDPTEAVWVIHWGSFSYRSAEASRREVFLRATFRRNKSGSISAPSWRILSRAEVQELTGRHYP